MRVWLSKSYDDWDWISVHPTKPVWSTVLEYWHSGAENSECVKHFARLCRGSGVKLPKTAKDLVEVDIRVFPVNGKK